jgi:hypothetical protein
MGPAIADVLCDIIHGSLHAKLESVTGGPNVLCMGVVARNCTAAGVNFSISRLLDLGIWMTLECMQEKYFPKFKPL